MLTYQKLVKKIKAGEQVGVIESVKAASDLFAPVSGEIININNELQDKPQLINTDAENSGWYMKVKLKDINEFTKLMNIDQYKEIIKQ